MQLFNSQRPAYQSNEAIFRSAPMTLVQFYVTLELARELAYTLGKSSQVHFRDLNSKLTPFQRTFISEIRDIDAIDSSLSALEKTMFKYQALSGDPYQGINPDEIQLPSSSELDDIKASVKDFHSRIEHLDDSYSSLEKKRFKLIENRHVLNIVQNFHKSSLVSNDRDEQVPEDFRQFEIEDDEEALLNSGRRSDSFDIQDAELHQEHTNLDEGHLFNSICGVLAREKIPILRKILWRTLRGNLYFNDIPVDELLPASFERDSDMIEKNAFIIFIHGDYLKQRVRRIIESLDGCIYDNTGGGAGARLETLREVNSKIEDLSTVVETTRNHLVTELLIFKEKFADWSYIIKRERSILEVLNMFDEDSTRRCLVGEGWIPSAEFDNIRGQLKSLVTAKRNHTALPADNNQLFFSTDTLNTGADAQQGAHDNASSDPDALFSIDGDHEGAPGIGFGGHEDDEDADFDFIAVVNELSTNRTPPTYHKTNKFTNGFQAIVDTYGIATYREVNPGLATIITFPFMFAIMFGDFGHGFIVLLVALYFIKNEGYFNSMRKRDEILDMAYGGRYIVLLMGIFSMYTGLMYNDVFSKSFTLFNSSWKWEFPEGYEPAKNESMPITASRIGHKVYPFGIDWAWHGSENNLLFTNSYKMKMSVLMGYLHMNYSLMFSLVNYRFFGSRVDVLGNFIPGFIFMQSIFGYLSLTIVYKWCVDWLGTQKQPPGLLNMLINMFLAPGKIEDQLYPGQKFVQIVLVLMALICVPWLLAYKPLMLRRENNRAKQLGYSDVHSQHNHALQLQEEEQALFDQAEEQDGENESSHRLSLHSEDEVDRLGEMYQFPNDMEPMNHNSSSHGSDGDGFNFLDIVIHQVIHTIEFCLNCVSHTASYLRLWALSLAHAQLSQVLWTMTILNAFGTTGAFGIFMTFVLFAMWFTLTVCILVMMEGTSAMLHSLRLHWVEAMSKFFEGEGYAYDPFSFDKIDL